MVSKLAWRSKGLVQPVLAGDSSCGRNIHMGLFDNGYSHTAMFTGKMIRVATVRFSSVSSNLTGVTLGSVTVRFGSNWYG